MSDHSEIYRAILQTARISTVEHDNIMRRLDLLDLQLERIMARIEGRAPVAPMPIAEPPA